MLAFSILWVALATAVVLLATVRKVASSEEDGILRVRDAERRIIHQQVAVAKRLDSIDQWGKLMTGAAVVYGLLLLAGFCYVGWQNSQQILR